jgi:23S rRNA (guanine745-N1)-methyltransferase
MRLAQRLAMAMPARPLPRASGDGLRPLSLASVATRESGDRQAPWRCPVCREALGLADEGKRWLCELGHSFDVAKQGYVNLLLAGQRRSRQPGDSAEMVAARRRFLATGAYDPVSAALAEVVAMENPATVLDIGCGEGRHTRKVRAPMMLGFDVAKSAVAAAARADPQGWYAVASAAAIPLADAGIDVAISVFGPVVPAEFARVIRPGGCAVTVHPGPAHLAEVRALIYSDARPHQVKSPLRGSADYFTELSSTTVSFPVVVREPQQLNDLFAMTPYRWHAKPDILDRLAAAARSGFTTAADMHLTTYRRTTRPAPRPTPRPTSGPTSGPTPPPTPGPTSRRQSPPTPRPTPPPAPRQQSPA